MEIINKKKLNKAVLDKNIKVFVVYVTSLSFILIQIHPTEKAQIVLLVIEEV